MSIRPLDQYQQMTDVVLQDDPAIAKYETYCSDSDYFSSLLGLMQEAAGGKKSIGEQNGWILHVYEEIIDRKVAKIPQRLIALKSALDLIHVLNGLYNGQRYGSYYSIFYNTAYRTEPHAQAPLIREFEGASDDENLKALGGIDCLEMKSVILAGAFPSNPQFFEQLRNHNPISFFIYVWSAVDSVLWEKDVSRLREAVLKEGLARVFPDKGDLYQAYVELFPVVSRLFDLASDRQAALQVIPKESDCCVIL